MSTSQHPPRALVLASLHKKVAPKFCALVPSFEPSHPDSIESNPAAYGNCLEGSKIEKQKLTLYCGAVTEVTLTKVVEILEEIADSPNPEHGISLEGSMAIITKVCESNRYLSDMWSRIVREMDILTDIASDADAKADAELFLNVKHAPNEEFTTK